MSGFFSIYKKKFDSKAQMGIIMILLILIGVTHFWFYNHQRDLIKSDLENLDKEFKENAWLDIESVIRLGKKAARKHATEVASGIIEDIYATYPDPSVLKDELDRVGYGSPEFIKIIHKNISGKYLFDIKNRNNDIFVISRQGIVLDMDVDKLEKGTRNFTDEATLHFNPTLMYRALDNLILHKDNTLIFYEPEDPLVKDHIIVTSPSKDALKEVYMTEGLEGLKGYNILVPAYITDDGDVFGVPDVAPDGTKNKNHKIIVVQSFSIYDVMQSLGGYTQYKEKSFMYARKGMADSMNCSSAAYLGAMILDAVAILFLLFYATEKGAHNDDESSQQV